MCCKNLCLCLRKCVCVCADIIFFWLHITKNMHRCYIDTEKAVMWPALSKMPNRKQANIIIIGSVIHLFWATYTEGIMHLRPIFLNILPFYTELTCIGCSDIAMDSFCLSL